jgi:hypothetical protein
MISFAHRSPESERAALPGRTAATGGVILAVLLAACTSSSPVASGGAVGASPTAPGGPLASGPASSSGTASGTVDSCTVLAADEISTLVGTPVTQSKAGVACIFTGPNGDITISIKTVDPGTKSKAMDLLVSGGAATAIPGLGHKAIYIPLSAGVDVEVLKGSTLVDVVLTLSNKSPGEMLTIAQQIAGEILGKL